MSNKTFQEGATIHIIYEILKRMDKISESFEPEEIVRRYKQLQNDPCIKEIKEKFGKGKKNYDNLKDSTKLKGWIKKHLKTEVVWFEEEESSKSFRLKQDKIDRLEKNRKKLRNC